MLADWDLDRREPYTEIGIGRGDCIRCGATATAQWQVCADKRRYRRVCTHCDIAINRLVLEFMLHPDVDKAMSKYIATKVV